jgi:hypothetical protein
MPDGRLFDSNPPLELTIIKNGCPGELTLKLSVSPAFTEIDGSFPDTLPF